MGSSMQIAKIPESIKPLRLSTEHVAATHRHEWLHEVIGKQYANVLITPPSNGGLLNDMTIYPWESLQISVIRSSGITIERLPHTSPLNSQDAYFAVILLDGAYQLEQGGREVFLQPGDMTIYDATRPHRIYCPQNFRKLIVSIPRAILRNRLAGVESCTAMRIPGNAGLGEVASSFVRSVATNIEQLAVPDLFALSAQSLDLITRAITSVRPNNYQLSRSRSTSLTSIKAYVELKLSDSSLSAEAIARGVGFSSRYINELFKDEETSLMRYIWQRRVEQCRKELQESHLAVQRISDIAYRWGFNDISHFSRFFKQQYGCSPREYRGHNQ